MAIGDLPSNKLMSLALQGYTPFQPEVGIFSGAYQGMMYPNPTTLTYPGFDPYQYTEPTMSVYTPNISYNGLGVGNPGIDYKNAGHILGLLDTFGRMSYGVGAWINIHAGDNSLTGPIIDLSVPMTDAVGNFAPLSLDEIYPAFTEIPSDWIDGFDVNTFGEIDPDVRPDGAFVSPGVGHSPAVNEIDIAALNSLFKQRSIFSYLGMPQYFRSIIESLANSADALTSLAEHDFTLEDDSYFNGIGAQLGWFTENLDPNFVRMGTAGKAYVQCSVLSPLQSLNTFNGTSAYHDGTDGQNEYRSMTELNSVINLIPLQMVGATYWNDLQGFTVTFPSSGPAIITSDEFDNRTFQVASYMIADFIINISDVPTDIESGPGTVDIVGEATVNNLVIDPSPFYVTQTVRLFSNVGPGDIVVTELGAIQQLRKDIDIYISVDNSFTWDKVWLGGDSIDSSDHFEDTFIDSTLGGNSDVGLEVLADVPLIVPFSKNITLGKGCTSIRMRAFLKNRHLIVKDAVAKPDTWVPEQFCHEHSQGLLPPTFHCHTPPGIISMEPAGNPGAISQNLTVPNLSLTFTVTGSNMTPLTFDISL